MKIAKVFSGSALMLAALYAMHHAVSHHSGWEGFAAICVGVVGAVVTLDA